MVWPHLKILWHDKDDSAGNSENNKMEKIEEEMVRQHQRMDKTGVWKMPEGSGKMP